MIIVAARFFAIQLLVQLVRTLVIARWASMLKHTMQRWPLQFLQRLIFFATSTAVL
jgi:hypothetical protein